ncbi:hypothetical protein N7474_006137 [Penicillium riverlandense]|uniref:uncharacterized protein n=1 Tax=Penicillium riverlandense TaxID=1903569 RepID=UPI002549890F|nr:uncharacterized protein N7474_006137 [Penicillium riverlandense]KAJ5820546.1 hypothetical protein N7474_006137 [Penicillium riverlandense]
MFLMAITSDLVNDSKLPVRFSTDYTHHDVFESDPRPGQQIRRRRKTETWRKEKHIGEGGFGGVWLEQCLTTDSQTKFRAVKVIPKVSPFSQAIDYTRELEAIAKFSQEKYKGLFAKSFGWYEDKKHVFIAMEYFELGDLQKHLMQPLPEREAQQVTHQLLEGLEQLHMNGFAHRDLKPANIFVVRKGPDWWVKIGDFGISKRVNDGSTSLRTAVGTPGFIAPEVLENDESDFQYTDKVDMWSLGVITHYILTAALPFEKQFKLRRYIQDCHFPSSALASCGVSQECHDFIMKGLLTATAASRLSASDALQHQWLKSFLRIAHRSHMAQQEETYPSPGGTLAQVLQGQGDTLEHNYTELTSIYQDGLSRYHQGRYKEAENMFRRALQGQEQVLGYDHVETLYSAHWLGLCLFERKLYKEAETTLQRALERREKVLGHDNVETLYSTHFLGLCLYEQNQHKDAETMLRRVLEAREKVLGHDHVETLHSAHFLGLCLYEQKRHKEAVTMLRRALERREKVLGHGHVDTLYSAQVLGLCLYEQGLHKGAEIVLRRALQGQEKVLGHDHADTLYSARFLGFSLYRQKRYKEAETMFRRVQQGVGTVQGHNPRFAETTLWADRAHRRSHFPYF